MFLHEKRAAYWLQIVPEVNVAAVDLKPQVENFTLGSFEEERLGEKPPESDWSDWFPPQPSMTDWELDEFKDWVDVESAKHILSPDSGFNPQPIFTNKEKYES